MVMVKPGASGSQRPSPSQTNLTVQATGHASGARSRLCGHAHWLLSAFCRHGSPKSSPHATHKPQVEPKRLALDLYLWVEEGAEVKLPISRGSHLRTACGSVCDRCQDIWLPRFWHPRAKYPSIFCTPVPDILRIFGTLLGYFAPPIHVHATAPYPYGAVLHSS